ncbi:amino acid permease, partial [Yersinia enterocolitica]|nr:amino acid permease [Yersinia enterocolitica]
VELCVDVIKRQGRWGAIFISIGLIISVMGAYLSWTLLAAEALYCAAKSNIMPSVLATENKHGVPSAAVWMSNIFIQLFLIVTLFTEYAFQLALELTSSLVLIPYLLVAAYGLKLAWTRETYTVGAKDHKKDFIIASIATFYAVLMVYAGGLKYILLSAVIYGPGTLLFIIAKREQKKLVFSAIEKCAFAVALIAAVAALYSLATGIITV